MRATLMCASVALALISATAAFAQEKSQQNAADEALVKGDLDAAKKSGDPRKAGEAEQVLERAAETAKNKAATAPPVHVGPQFTELSEQQRRTIYDTVIREQPATEARSSEIGAMEVGAVLPPNVELHTLPGDVTGQIPGTSAFRYLRAGDRVLLVEPTERIVVGVLGGAATPR